MRAALLGAFLSITAFAAISHAQPTEFFRYDHPAIGAPRTIVAADFNGDGYLDVAVGGTTRASIGILLHHGHEDGDDGERFKPLMEIVVGGGPFELAVGDLNRDGRPDLVVANADLNTVTILLNDGVTPFSGKIDVPVSHNPRGLAIGDFNRDGIPDIIVTKYQASTLEILYGAGDGTFPTRRSLPAPTIAQGVAVADFNGDGWLDAVVASVNGTVAFYYMRQDGTATRQDVRPSSDGWNVVTTGDFNRDGLIDVALASTGGSVVQVLTRTTAGSGWTWGSPIPVASSPRGIDAADVNMDGWPDLVVAGRASSTVSVLFGGPDGGYTHSQYPAGTGARAVALGDFDQSGRIDLLTANEYGNSVTVLTQAVDTRPVAFAFDPFVPPDSHAFRIYGVEDFNRNGTPDFITSGSVLLDGVTGSRGLLPQFVNADAAVAGDFNRDGRLDVVYAFQRSFQVFHGDGAGDFTDGPRIALDGAVSRLATADLNRDGIPDLVVLLWRGAVQVWLGQPSGGFVQHQTFAGAFNWMEIADVNRDGITDIAVSGDGITVLLGDGLGGWGDTRTFGAGVTRHGFAIGQTAGDDAIPDLAIADSHVDTWGESFGPVLTVARGLGDGTFEEHARIDTTDPDSFNNGIVSLLLADLDHDGFMDIFTNNGLLLRGNGGGEFTAPERFGVYSGVYDATVAADVNRDGLTDLVGYYPNHGHFESNIMLNTRRAPAQNRPPVGLFRRDVVTWDYATAFWDDDADLWAGAIFDPDLHAIRYLWTLSDGTVLSRASEWWPGRDLTPGDYEVTVTVDDYRGGSDSDTFIFRLLPHEETVMIVAEEARLSGAWRFVDDETAAGGRRAWHPDAGAPKRTQALANPSDYVEMVFLADPTQEYKLWVRLKAQNNHWGNDSVFVQFTGAEDGAGNPIYQIGTTSALDVNLEECSGCGISGWGWEDDGWGAVNRNGVTLRFPEGGVQMIRIQTREDGVSIDQVVMSSRKYLTTRPGTAKNDTTILPKAGPYLHWW